MCIAMPVWVTSGASPCEGQKLEEVGDMSNDGFSRNGSNITARGWARDLSESGLRAFVAEPLVIGEQVTLEIALPSFKKEQIPARVARQLGTRYGFQFTALSFQQRYEIRAATKAQPLVPD